MIQLLGIKLVIGFIGIAIFELLLALGLPLGKAAWGGQHRILPTNLRIASFVSVFIYIFASYVVLSEASLLGFSPDAFTSIAIWVFVVLFFSGVIMNGISRSKLERNIMTPIALLFFIFSLIIALN